MTRPTCPRCHTPFARCFCDLVVTTDTALRIIIWQHPGEAGHAKGTVPLLSRCLTNSCLVIAETLSREAFELATASRAEQLHLLFPAGDTGTGSAAEPETPTQHLLVLDGTWRKARKLLYLNPWLNELPRLELQNPSPGRYHIRKAENPRQLSTLEAVCAAIAQTENSSENTRPILKAFDSYLARLSQYQQNRPDPT